MGNIDFSWVQNWLHWPVLLIVLATPHILWAEREDPENMTYHMLRWQTIEEKNSSLDTRLSILIIVRKGKWPDTSVSEVSCCVYCFQLMDSLNSRAILWQILKQHQGRSFGLAQIFSIFNMLINAHGQSKGGYISEILHHTHQVLYIFGILGSSPPPSCIQITIWAPHGPPNEGASLWVSFIAIF